MPATNTVKAAELRGLSRDELNHKVGELKEELFTLRFSDATGQLQSNARLRAVRKDIARIYTVLQERALGIIEDPDATDAEAAAADGDDAETDDAETATAPARKKKK